MIIDSHCHPGKLNFGLDKVLENMAECHIDKAWLISWEASANEYAPSSVENRAVGPDGYPLPFSQCLSYAQQAPDQFILGYAPDPRLPDAIDRLGSAIQQYGVRIYGELKLRMPYDAPEALRMYHFCGQKGLPVLVHIDYQTASNPYWCGGGIEAFERAVVACPETVFIGHAPGFWSHISGDSRFDTQIFCTDKVVPGGKVVEMLRKYPNVWADLSAGSGRNALNRDHDFARAFLREFQDRILYGRDDFDNKLQELLNSLELPVEVLDKIYSKNALRLLGR